MQIPAGTKTILERLGAAGYEAYAVGGCVRDSLLGKVPQDWDICTSALPTETEACFADLRIIETGLKHGTVTILLEKEPFEVTTFREDGDYADHRRPDGVRFVRSLYEDLQRRDFTVNAMAADAEGNVIDLVGGQKDLGAKIIRCVGDSDRRFEEDALRILRAMRFASVLGFTVEAETAAAMHRKKDLLRYVSGERILKELTKLLTGKNAVPVLREFTDVVTTIIPELKDSVGFDQHSVYHNKDVWEHTLDAVEKSRPDPVIRWTLLLHDIGKPACFTLDANGRGHFYGHPAKSADMAREILTRFHADNRTIDTVFTLVRWHDADEPAGMVTARRWVGKYGREQVRLLLEVKRCDCLAHADTPRTRMRYDNLMTLTEQILQVMETEDCFRVTDLKLNGRDVMASGVPKGAAVGRVLEKLLDAVITGQCTNDSEALRNYLSGQLAEKGETLWQ